MVKTLKALVTGVLVGCVVYGGTSLAVHTSASPAGVVWPSSVTYNNGDCFDGPTTSADVQAHFDTMNREEFEDWFRANLVGGVVDATMQSLDVYSLSWSSSDAQERVYTPPSGTVRTEPFEAPVGAAAWIRGTITGWQGCEWGACSLVVDVVEW